MSILSSGGAAAEHVSLDELEDVLKSTPGVRNVESKPEDGIVTFNYRDKDDDVLVAIVHEIDDQHIEAVTSFGVPQDHLISSFFAANAWNGESFSHGTFSVMSYIPARTNALWL